MQRCVQCWKMRKPAMFIGALGLPIKTCKICRKLYARGERRATRRAKIDRVPVQSVRFVALSKDRKLGGIPASYSSGRTCPDACKLKDNGCYAEFGFVRHQWQQPGILWLEFLQRIRQLPTGTLWRHNIAGDLPGENNLLDVPALRQLRQANAGRRGFTFTHKPLRTASERKAIRACNAEGFTVNLSADSLAEADRKAMIGPTVVTLPHDAPRGIRTPGGRHVVLCPAETHGLNCAACQLCAQPQRKSIIGFRAHGQFKLRVIA